MTETNDVDFPAELAMMLEELKASASAFVANPTDETTEALAMTAFNYGSLVLASMGLWKEKLKPSSVGDAAATAIKLMLRKENENGNDR